MRESSTSSTVIGSRNVARGFIAAHSRWTTATLASCSWLTPRSFMNRSAGMVNMVGGPVTPNGASNCAARPPRPPQGAVPTRDRPLSAWVIMTVLHSPASIAAAAWRTWIMNEQPPTEVPSTQCGVMPR
ncbi:MAG: hypothetical protein R2704_08035 [Microthrixaceae bacterium]